MFLNLETLIIESEQEIRAKNPATSYPDPFPVPEGYAVVFPSPTPIHDVYSQKVVSATTVLTDKGHYEQRWEVVELSGEELLTAQELKRTSEATAESLRIDSLWKAATTYEQQAISGSAIGLITLGVIQAKPKALAVQSWIQAIWTEYYARKASGSNDTNYTIIGECPHTVPELMVELGL